MTKEKKYLIDNPKLMAEWNWGKNNELGLDPKTLTCGSSKKVWWKCLKCGYEWQAKIMNRSNGRNCPCCSNRVVVEGVNDLGTTNPELIKEWDWIKNNELDINPNKITKGVNKKVWWICPNGHEYLASVLHRSSGTGCPICNTGRQSSFAEQAIYYYVKKYYPDAQNKVKNIYGTRFELDIFIPSLNVAIEYDGGYWHEREKAIINEQKKFELCRKKGIILIRVREPQNLEFNKEGYTKILNTAIDSSSIKANYVIFADKTGNNKNLNKVIGNLFRVLNEVSMFYNIRSNYNVDINIERDKENIYKALNVEYSKSLRVGNPKLTEEWNYEKNMQLTPEQVSYNTRRKVWWKCTKCGYEWQTTIQLRNKGSGCPKCAIFKNKGGTHAEAKCIYQYQLNGKFVKKWDCISTAARELNVNSSNITMCAKHIRPNAGGYRWEYAFLEKLNPIIKMKKSRKGLNSKRILQCDLNYNIIEEFSSLSEASIKLKINATSISKALNGHIKTAGGFCWRFA